LAEAKNLQNKYDKGPRQARFSSIPVEFFHTAVEAKIQSNVTDAKKDIDNLKKIHESNPSVIASLFSSTHEDESETMNRFWNYAQQKGIEIFEYTSKRNGTTLNRK
jgi:hypothetical protein